MYRIVAMLTDQTMILESLSATHQIIGVVDCSLWPAKGKLGKIINLRNWFDSRYREKNSLFNWSRRAGVNYISYDPSKLHELEEWLRKQTPDVVVTNTAPLLCSAIFQIPKHGTINSHYSLLPEYRGGSPVLWQLLNDEEHGGVTIHFIDEGIDTGAILYQQPIPLEKGASRNEIFCRLDKITSSVLPGIVSNVCSDNYNVTEQAHLKTNFFAKNVKCEALLDIIQWNDWPVEKVWRILRYFEFWPDQFARVDGWRRYLRWKVGPFNTQSNAGIETPFVLSRDKKSNKVTVKTRNGSIELQPVFSATSFINKIVKDLL